MVVFIFLFGYRLMFFPKSTTLVFEHSTPLNNYQPVLLDSVVKDHWNIDIEVVSYETIHHDPVTVLKVFICLAVFVQYPICEEEHVKRNKANTKLVKHF